MKETSENLLIEADSFASKEEKWFSYYLAELKARGYVKKYVYQPDSYELSSEFRVHIYETRKDHNELVDIKMLNGHSYTADFLVEWTNKAKNKLFWEVGGVYPKGAVKYSKTRRDAFIPFMGCRNKDREIVSVIDTKGTFGASDRSFSITQKWMASQGVYVQKVVVSLCEKGIFYRTFFPRAVVAEEVYKKDGRRGNVSWKAGDSKIKVDVKLIEHWL